METENSSSEKGNSRKAEPDNIGIKPEAAGTGPKHTSFKPADTKPAALNPGKLKKTNTSPEFMEALNTFYADKTMMLKAVIDSEARNFLFAAPPGFGKTLMLSMIHTFFEDTGKDIMPVFKNMDIGKYGGAKYLNEAGKYPVVHLDLAPLKNCISKEETGVTLKKIIIEEMSRFPMELDLSKIPLREMLSVISRHIKLYYAHVIVLTDDLVPYPNLPSGIRAADVESVVVVDSVGDSSKISAGAIRDSKNPRDILLAKSAAKVVINSGLFVDGFSIQTGTGGASLAVVKYIREEMLSRGIKASFALGGITAHMVKLHEEGLIGTLIDVQSFDKVAAENIAVDPSHIEVSAVEYASGQHLGSATHALDIVILSALEVDTQFNVNVLVGSDGIIRGAIGGHQDTAADSALSIIVCPLLRGRIPCVVPHVREDGCGEEW